MLKKLQKWILPEEIDFFRSMSQQSILTAEIIEELKKFYVENTSQDHLTISNLIEEAKRNRLVNLEELNSAFITPVDKEAISRVYAHLHWVALSIKHLVIEVDTYKIYELNRFRTMFDILCREVERLTQGFKMLGAKKYHRVMENVDEVIHLDNELIEEYANILAALFTERDIQEIFKYKEILSQLKEISKRIHICANHLEDIVFKMN